jgi:TPR repeat protein
MVMREADRDFRQRSILPGCLAVVAALLWLVGCAGPGSDQRANVPPLSAAALRAAQDAPEMHQVALLERSSSNAKIVGDLLAKAADAGNPVALVKLGDRYRMSGNGPKVNLAAATAFYRKAATQGYAPAEVALGKAYRLGEGVAVDTSEAAYWYRQAADQGDGIGQLLYGVALFAGDGVPQDEKRGLDMVSAAQDSSPDTVPQLRFLSVKVMIDGFAVMQAAKAGMAAASSGATLASATTMTDEPQTAADLAVTVARSL